MSKYDKDLTGVVFKNNKQLTEKHPVYTGSATIAGVEYRLAGWVNEHPEHGKWLSLKFQTKEDAPKTAPKSRIPDDALDLPF